MATTQAGRSWGRWVSMLSIGQGQADYYLEAVSQGFEDYYAGAGRRAVAG